MTVVFENQLGGAYRGRGAKWDEYGIRGEQGL